MRITGARMLSVVNNRYDRKLLGVVSRVEVLSVTSTRSDLKIREIMSQPVIVLDENTEIFQAAKQMLNIDEWYVPVVKGEEYRGMLGLENIIMWIMHQGLANKERTKRISEIMTRDVKYVFPEDPLTKVWYLMLKHRYAGIPVVNTKTKIMGIVTQYDILSKGRARIRLESENEPLKITVKEVMSKPAITISQDEKIELAADIMVKRNIGRLIVTDDKKHLIGIIDRMDVLKGLLGW